MKLFIKDPSSARRTAADDVREALAAWKESVRYFEAVSDPELVDFAVYEMEAARRKYMFLLKRAGGAAAE